MEKRKASKASPIQNLGLIDIMVEKKDGTVDLYIIAATYLDASARTQKRLLDKVENYLRQVNGKEYRQNFGKPSKARVSTDLI